MPQAEYAGTRRARNLLDPLSFFPDLRERSRQRAGSLGGGQQQMLAIARALAARPDLILLDEPTEGLSPMMVETIRGGILRSRAAGAAILLVEQNLSLALSVADMLFIVSRGAIVFVPWDTCRAVRVTRYRQAPPRP